MVQGLVFLTQLRKHNRLVITIHISTYIHKHTSWGGVRAPPQRIWHSCRCYRRGWRRRVSCIWKTTMVSQVRYISISEKCKETKKLSGLIMDPQIFLSDLDRRIRESELQIRIRPKKFCGLCIFFLHYKLCKYLTWVLSNLDLCMLKI